MSENSFASWRVYDPNGLQITMSVLLGCEIDGFTDTTAMGVRRAIDAMLASGFSVNAPETVAGEELKVVFFVSRRAKLNEDGSETPIIDLFAEHPKMNYKMFSHYLNREDDIEAFEAVSGLRLLDIPLYDEEQAIRKDHKKASQYIVECPKHPRVVLAHNPRYNPEEEDIKKRKPQFLFNRWVGYTVDNQPDGSAQDGGDPNATRSSESGSSGQGNSGKNSSGAGSASTGAGSSNKNTSDHWAAFEANRKLIIREFENAGVDATNNKAILAAMQEITPGIERMSQISLETYPTLQSYQMAIREIIGQGKRPPQSQEPNEPPFETDKGNGGIDFEKQRNKKQPVRDIDPDDDPFALDNTPPTPPPAEKQKSPIDPPLRLLSKPFKSWTDDVRAEFDKYVTGLFPDLSADMIRKAVGTVQWQHKPEEELAKVLDVAREERWRVVTDRVFIHKGKGKQDSYITFYTALGVMRWYKGTTKLGAALGEGYARANKVGDWRNLEEPRTIEPILLDWDAQTSDIDNTSYHLVEEVSATDTLSRFDEGKTAEDDPFA